MCGLVGVISKYPAVNRLKKIDLFEQMLYVDALRGYHSTGIAVVNNKKDLVTYKRALAAPDFLCTKTFVRIARSMDAQVMMGHNRAATHGSVIDANAHPFRHGDITLMHNGTVNNHKSLPEGRQFEVDSDYISYSINEYGVDDTISQLQGAFALVWYNSADGTVNVVKNNKRDLGFALAEDGKTFIYASEADMIPWIANRNEVVLDDDTWYNEFKNGTLYTIQPDQPSEWAEREVELYTPPKVHYAGRGRPQNSASNQGSGLPAVVSGTVSSSNVLSASRGGSLITPEEAIKKLGYSLGDTIEMSVEEIEDRSSLCIMKLLEPSNVPIAAKVNCYYFYSEEDGEEEMLLNSFAENKIIRGIIAGCRHNPKFNEFTVYIKDIDSITSEAQNEEEEEDDTLSPIAMFPGPKNRTLTAVEFIRLVKEGCCECTGNIDLSDAPHIGWTYDGQPFCPTCTEKHRHAQSNNGDVPGYVEQ
jgi:predicted glutamine amidotransferase